METGINYNIIRKKVKNIRISVGRGKEVKIIVPLKYPSAEINRILKEKQGWIEKKILYFDNLEKHFLNLNANEILYLGGKYVFVFKEEMKNTFLVDSDSKKIFSGVNLLEKNIQEIWLKQEARRIIEERAELLNANKRFRYRKIFIRSQNTKWGNCSSSGNVSFNWRLVKSPLTIIDYLIVHELVHLEEMNHSYRFWDKVSELYPDYKNADKWLKNFGAGLFY